MNQHLTNSTSSEPPRKHQSRRQHDNAEDPLILSELNPDSVIDHLHVASDRLDLTTSGSVRESCPKCQDTHLKLVLCQDKVCIAHLFCAECESCFDAHYANGAPALTV